MACRLEVVEMELVRRKFAEAPALGTSRRSGRRVRQEKPGPRGRGFIAVVACAHRKFGGRTVARKDRGELSACLRLSFGRRRARAAIRLDALNNLLADRRIVLR